MVDLGRFGFSSPDNPFPDEPNPDEPIPGIPFGTFPFGSPFRRFAVFLPESLPMKLSAFPEARQPLERLRFIEEEEEEEAIF